MNILSQILIHKRQEVAQRRRDLTILDLKAMAKDMPAARDFKSAIRGLRLENEPRGPRSKISVISEIKKASPSAGVIRPDFDPVAIAKSYEAHGAAAISCLTDEKWFQGSLDIFDQVRAAVDLPMLRKEFIADDYQIWEARVHGADAVLFIAGFVGWPDLYNMRETAHKAGLAVLLEVHSASELEVALEFKPDVLGINNRNLRAREMKTDLNTTRELLPEIPRTTVVISESGIRTEEDVRDLAQRGIDGILVGEHLMREPDPGLAIVEKLGLGWKEK